MLFVSSYFVVPLHDSQFRDSSDLTRSRFLFRQTCTFVIVEHFATVYSVLLVANVIAEQSLVIASANCFVVLESFVNEGE